jgi:hypothetical protein
MMSTAMQIIVEPGGAVRCIYSEEIDLAALGSPAIVRASHVEPDQQGRWWADLSPVVGPLLGPFGNRSEALAAEQQWLEAHWLGCKGNRFPRPRAVSLLKME